MSDRMQGLLKQYTDGVHRIYRDALKEVILYGSYARGDYNIDSDVDIMILVNLSEEEIENSDEMLIYTYDFNMEHNVLIMPIIKSVSHFDYWRSVYPFYQNVETEGVDLYVS